VASKVGQRVLVNLVLVLVTVVRLGEAQCRVNPVLKEVSTTFVENMTNLQYTSTPWDVSDTNKTCLEDVPSSKMGLSEGIQVIPVNKDGQRNCYFPPSAINNTEEFKTNFPSGFCFASIEPIKVGGCFCELILPTSPPTLSKSPTRSPQTDAPSPMPTTDPTKVPSQSPTMAPTVQILPAVGVDSISVQGGPNLTFDVHPPGGRLLGVAETVRDLPFQIAFRCFFGFLLVQKIGGEAGGVGFAPPIPLSGNTTILELIPELDYSEVCLLSGATDCKVNFTLRTMQVTQAPTAATPAPTPPTLQPSRSPLAPSETHQPTKDPTGSPSMAPVRPTPVPVAPPTLELKYSLDEFINEILRGVEGLEPNLEKRLYTYYTGFWDISESNQNTKQFTVPSQETTRAYLRKYSAAEVAYMNTFTLDSCPHFTTSGPTVPPVPNSSGDGDDTGLIIGLAVGIGVLFVAILMFVKRKKVKELLGYKPSNTKEIDTERPEIVDAEYLAESGLIPEIHSEFKDLEIDENLLTLGSVIGHGANGRIFKASYCQSDVAVKELFPTFFESADSQIVVDPNEQIWREVRNLRLLRHPNVIQLYGCSRSRSGDSGQWRFLVVMELAMCSLRELLHETAPPSKLPFTLDEFDDSKRSTLTKEICSGLAYIHDTNMIHFDIKPENILLNAAGQAKICDLGISKLHHGPNQTINVTMSSAMGGTPPYMAPELLRGVMEQVGSHVDVYAFGIVLWQIYHPRKFPHPQNWSVAKLFHEVLVCNFRPEISADVQPLIRDLMQQCWAPDFRLRPTFHEVIRMLDANNVPNHFEMNVKIGAEVYVWEHIQRRYIKCTVKQTHYIKGQSAPLVDIKMDREDYESFGIDKKMSLEEYYSSDDDDDDEGGIFAEKHLNRIGVYQTFLKSKPVGNVKGCVYDSIISLSQLHFNCIMEMNDSRFRTMKTNAGVDSKFNEELSLYFEEDYTPSPNRRVSSSVKQPSFREMNSPSSLADKGELQLKGTPDQDLSGFDEIFETEKMSFVPFADLDRSDPGVFCAIGVHLPTFSILAIKHVRLPSISLMQCGVNAVSSAWEDLLGVVNDSDGRIIAREFTKCPQLVNFYGCLVDNNDQAVTLLYEYMNGGSLQHVMDNYQYYCPRYVDGNATDDNDSDDSNDNAVSPNTMDFNLLPTCICRENVLAHIAQAVLKAIAFLHKHKKKHLNIRPSNILIDNKGNVKLGDFGLNGEWRDNEISGPEMQYCSPEQMEGEKDPETSSDVWSFGMTMLSVTLGHHPFHHILSEADGPETASLLLRRFMKYNNIKLASRCHFPAPAVYPQVYEATYHFSDEYVDFLASALATEPSMRAKAEELLQHPWIVNSEPPPVSAGVGISIEDNVELASDITNCILQRIAVSLESRRFFNPSISRKDSIVVKTACCDHLARQLDLQDSEAVKDSFIYNAHLVGIASRAPTNQGPSLNSPGLTYSPLSVEDVSFKELAPA